VDSPRSTEYVFNAVRRAGRVCWVSSCRVYRGWVQRSPTCFVKHSRPLDLITDGTLQLIRAVFRVKERTAIVLHRLAYTADILWRHSDNRKWFVGTRKSSGERCSVACLVLSRRRLQVAMGNKQSIALIGCDWSRGTPPPGESTMNDFNGGATHAYILRVYVMFGRRLWLDDRATNQWPPIISLFLLMTVAYCAKLQWCRHISCIAVQFIFELFIFTLIFISRPNYILTTDNWGGLKFSSHWHFA